MQIDAITTGTVEIKNAMHIGRPPLRLARALADRTYTGHLPIHAWVIRHPDGPILIDTGELSTSRDMPIARFHVTREDEIDRQLAALEIEPGELQAVVVTHLHGDHMNGAQRLSGAKIVVAADSLTWFGRSMLSRRSIAVTPFELSDGPFGAFSRSARVTPDGSVVAVAAPGHATGQIAVAVVEEERHVLIGADTAYTQEQLIDRKIDGVAVSARQAAATQGTILKHARRHPTVYLPSHDPQSADRLQRRALLEV
jgi:glyoxylase-like metal-dependent hydrolase (beta-lactamase superfamily II)